MSKKDWCFTINNAFEDATAVDIYLVDHPNPFSLSDNETLYWIFQLERGLSGTIHIQGYVEFRSDTGLKKLKREISPVAHWEGRRGPRESARLYCRKEDSRIGGPWEGGVWRERVQGIGSGLQDLITGIREGCSLTEVIERDPESYIRYRGGVERYYQRHLAISGRAKRQLRIIWYYGATGTGKSTRLFEQFPDAYVKDNTKWWNDYEGQLNVVWDEFDGTSDFRLALRWFDCWPCTVEVKGGSVALVFTTIAVSSVRHPAAYYTDEFGEWRRRICGGEIRKFERDERLGEVARGNTETLAIWDREKANYSDGFFRLGDF